ncbi:MAG TPA: hypothetical protein VM077_01080 [Candidatus Limnocylindrales bacterium]|nr:hypothetical protein [Candidatus Limnocylindrales bacterium]
MAKKKHKKTSSYGKQTLKALFIGISVVFFWRGAWGLMDIYLFPHDMLLSSTLSLGIGVGILFATHYIVKELI